MKTALRPLLAFLLVVGISTVVAPYPGAQAGGAMVGTPWTGAVGIHRTVAEIRAEEEALGPLPTFEHETERDKILPDRTALPQAPGAQEIAQYPLPEEGASAPAPGQGVFSPQTLGVNFLGATLFGINPTFAFPPDVMGAAGPTQYVVFVNGRVVSFDKSTGLADGVINADPDVFFSSVITPGYYTSDPRIRYDRLSARWILTIIDVSIPNRILIAVSDAASNGVITSGTVFTFFYIPIATIAPPISPSCLADYPTLGVDANALYIGTNNFCGASLTFNSTDGYVVRKSSVLGPGPIVVTVFRGLVPTPSSDGPYTPQGVDNYDPASSEGYFIGVSNVFFSSLVMRRVGNPGGVPTISADIALTTPGTTTFPRTVPHLGNTGGTSGRLSAIDDRLFAAHIRSGRLWTAQNIAVNNTGVASGTLTRNGSRWYEIQNVVSPGVPSFRQSGTVFTASGTNVDDQRYYWIPSLMVSGQGHAAMGFSTAGANERANAGTVGRLGSDVLGTMQTPLLYTSSSTAYNPPGDPGGGNGRRWGDYSYTSLDPIDDMSMWTIQEFCDATNSYGVQVVRLIAPAPATPTLADDALAGQPSFTVTVTGTSVGGSGFFDPGPNLAGGVPAFSHLTATVNNAGVTGTPPTVNGVTYLDPTHVQLDLNTTAATPNLPGEKYNVVITNPDGQSATGAMILQVVSPPTSTLLSLFQANPVAEGIELRWQFVQPELYARITVERSEAALGQWSVVDAEPRSDGAVMMALDRGAVPGRTYDYRLVVATRDGQTQTFGPIRGTAGGAVTELEIGTLAPNPTTGPVRIEFSLPRAAAVKLSVIDLQGREVATLVSGLQPPGRYQATWTGRTERDQAPAGIYFVRYQAEGRTMVRRLVLVR